MWGPSDEEIRFYKWLLALVGLVMLSAAFALGAWLL